MATISRIAIYPLKSFDPTQVEESVILPGGPLQYDRQFALMNAAGQFVNSKRTPLIHLLQAKLDPRQRSLVARRHTESEPQTWNIDADRAALESWFSDYFSSPVTLVENESHGFPDDNEATGPTIVSEATLQVVASWFPGLTLDQVRLRFRANLEVSGVAPFWEDELYGWQSSARPFRIGNVVLAGTNPCQRCVVPTRDPVTGHVWPEFAKKFAEFRAAQLPNWAARDRFNHFYRLTTNTRVLDAGGTIRVGDPVALAGPAA